MNDDAALLRSYVEDHSETAFAELVRRHIPLVYSVALRRVSGDAHLAEDVAQKVFVNLARKAASLRGHASLSGWLYVSAQLASADLVRGEQRRKTRETIAHSMHLEYSAPGPDADPGGLRPVLDDAIVALKGDDRDAIILRFFEKRSFSEIGDALRVTEEAARKRVDRALQKLHAVLARRGITSTTTALGLALTATTPETIPVGLATQVSTSALSQATSTAATSALTTISTLLLPAAALSVAGALLILPQHRANNAMAAEIARLSTELQSLPAVRSEKDSLARSLAVARDLQRTQAAQTIARAAAMSNPPPPPTSHSLNLTSEGTIVWEGKPITLDTYLEHLQSLRTTAPGGESQLVVNAKNVKIGQLAYVIDEARKAGIKHVLVDSDATPVTWGPWSWF